MNATDIAAWVGAFTGCFAFVWDIYKWRESQRKIQVSVDKFHNLYIESNVDHFSVKFTIRNVGDKVTTIEGYYGIAYKSYFHYKIRKSAFEFPIYPGKENSMPCPLDTGKICYAYILRDEYNKLGISNKGIQLVIHHSLSNKPYRKYFSLRNISNDIVWKMMQSVKSSSKTIRRNHSKEHIK